MNAAATQPSPLKALQNLEAARTAAVARDVARYVDKVRNSGEALALRGDLWARLARRAGAAEGFIEAVLQEATSRWEAEAARLLEAFEKAEAARAPKAKGRPNGSSNKKDPNVDGAGVWLGDDWMEVARADLAMASPSEDDCEVTPVWMLAPGEDWLDAARVDLAEVEPVVRKRRPAAKKQANKFDVVPEVTPSAPITESEPPAVLPLPLPAAGGSTLPNPNPLEPTPPVRDGRRGVAYQPGVLFDLSAWAGGEQTPGPARGSSRRQPVSALGSARAGPQLEQLALFA